MVNHPLLSSPAPLKVPFREAARGIEFILELMARLMSATMNVVAGAEVFLPSGEGESRPHGPVLSPGRRVVKVPERLRFLEEMGPAQILEGVRQGGGSPYLAFIFADVVVLECEAECNALYLFENAAGWMELAKTPKLELIRQRPAGFLGRIVHQGDWRARARDKVRPKA